MKLFKSSNIELIKECQGYFRCLLPSLNVKERCQKRISKYENSVNTFDQLYSPKGRHNNKIKKNRKYIK